MTLATVIENIHSAGIILWTEDGKLKFRAEKGAMTEDLKQSISAIKQELIDYLNKHNGQLPQENNTDVIQACSSMSDLETLAPLSFSQQRLWIIDQLEENSAAYNIPFALGMKGDLDVVALEKSVNALIQRHGALRTQIIIEGETPKQQIFGAEKITLTPEDVNVNDVQDIAEFELHTPFNLSQDRLFRVRLLRVQDKDHVLLLTLHHIIGDGWSMGILIRDLAVLYQATTTENQPVLPELTLSFTDYAWWQTEKQQSGAYNKELSYWLTQLKDAPTLHQFPTDKLRPPHQAFKGASVDIHLSKSLQNELLSFSQQNGVTLFMTLLAGLNTLLWKYSGQQDQVIGTPIANRKIPALENVIGFFANTLALRNQVDPNARFAEYLQSVKEVCLDAYAHQDVPFEKIVEELQPSRSLAHNPIFQIMLVLQNQVFTQHTTQDLKFEPVTQNGKVSRFDLMLVLAETDDGLIGQVEYDTALFNRKTMEILVERLRFLLESLCRKPQTRLRDISIELPSDKSLNITDCPDNKLPNGTSNLDVLRPTELIQDHFYRNVTNNGNAIALCHHDRQLSYRQLDDLANQFAHGLIELGVNKSSPVAVHFDKCPELIALIFAIWKTGACYVPLDPQLPRQRLEKILDDAQPVIVVHNASDIQLTHNHLISCEYLLNFCANLSTNRPKLSVDHDQAAYMVYSSGTTGKPKGIIVPHRTITNLMAWELKHIQGVHRVLQFTSVGFDPTFLEILLALNTGGTLLIVDHEQRTDTEYVQELIQRHEINLVIVPPTVLHHWATLDNEQPNKRLFQSLKHVITTGEQLQITSSICSFFDRYSHCQLHNQYGPAETHVVTAQTFCPPTSQWPKRAPIGHPIDNVHLRIVDSEGQNTASGIPGELIVSGPAVGLGYSNAGASEQDKFTVVNGEPCYRTGDKVQLNDINQLEFMGRLDRQVKVRGIRIELDEVEKTIDALAYVARSVVLVDTEIAASPQLVTWIVVNEKHADSDYIKKSLTEVLPAYMVPSQIYVVKNIPLNHNGKPDSKSLLASLKSAGSSVTKVAPRNSLEQQLHDIWQTLFPNTKLSVNDDFFAIGGHSLLATQLVSRINKKLQTTLSLRSIFEHSTIASLALNISDNDATMENEVTPLPAIKPNVKDANIPLSYAQQRLWILQQFDGIGGTYNMPVSLFIRGELNYAALNESINTILQRHEILRSQFRLCDQVPMQYVSDTSSVELVAQLVDEQAVEEIYKQEAASPFDLSNDLLFRFRLLKVNSTSKKQEHVLIVVQHHIISDGWSTGIFVEELTQCYSAFNTGRTPRLPKMPLQYADYAIWQRNWLQGEALERQLSYWRKTLKGMPPLLDLPTDRARPAVQSFRGRSLSMELTVETQRHINQFCVEQGVTLYMFLLASIELMLWRYSGQIDFGIGSPVANRNRPELELMLGCFVNTITLRAQVDPKHTFIEHLQQVKQKTLAAYGNQDIPFEQVVEGVNVFRNTSHSPLFQTMVVLQNTPKKELTLGDAEISSLPYHSTVSRFDMTFNFNDGIEGLSTHIEYNSDLFDESTIKRMFCHFAEIVSNTLSRPSANIGDISRTSTQSTELQLSVLQGAQTDYRKQSSIPQALEKIADQHPDKVALIWQQEQVTYSQLDHQAKLLAKVLLANGIAEGDVIGVHLDPSAFRIILLIAIAKVSAAYLPLEPSYPDDRLKFMVEDSGIALLISAQSNNFETDVPLLTVDKFNEPVSVASKSWPTPQADSALYLIYTSGSTGKPKPVTCTHRNILRLADSTSFGGLKDSAITLHHYPLSFDPSGLEIWGTLLQGGTLVVVSKEQKTLEGLSFSIQQYGVTTAVFSPLLLSEIIASHSQSLQKLKHIIVGGDVFSLSTAKLALKQLPSTNIYNAYGPTENGVISTIHQLDRERDYDYTLPIGQAIDNSFAVILDNQMNPVPLGAVGELWLGGDGLANGYSHRIELTEERFKHTADFGRIYKSGDLVRLNNNNELLYVGRNDSQIKLRGFRIELGEIESVLASAEGVEKVAVLLKGEKEHARLVAYLTPETLDLNQVRRHAFEQLTDFMQPSEFNLIEKMPLSPNGKIDRKQLSLIKQSSQKCTQEANSDEELRVMQAWQEVLSTSESIGVTTNFFDAGGNSLLVMRLRQTLNTCFKKNIPVTALFQYPTIQAQVEYLKSEGDAKKPAATKQGLNGDNTSKKQQRNANRQRRQKLKGS